jgi:hypothetical protein
LIPIKHNSHLQMISVAFSLQSQMIGGTEHRGTIANHLHIGTSVITHPRADHSAIVRFTVDVEHP